MTADELVEKVARELCAIMGDDPDDVTVDSNTGEPVTNWTIYASDARAAIAIVVEACAKVAKGDVYKDRYRTWPWWNGGNRGNDDRAVMLADQIAAAIRSLSPSSGSTGGDER